MSHEHRTEIDVTEGSSAVSDAMSIFRGKLADVVSQIPQEIWSLSETALAKEIELTDIDFMLRKNLHSTLDMAKRAGLKEVPVNRIYDGICTKQHFYGYILTKPKKVAWLFIPIHKYQDLLDESLYFVLKRVREELLTLPINEKTAPSIMKAFEFLANRALGPVIQRIESKNLNVEVKSQSSNINPEDLERKFLELKNSLTRTVVDVGSKDPE